MLGHTKPKNDPALKLILVINNNDDINTRKRELNKMCWFIHQIKKDCNVDYTNWDGRLIHTVSSIDVDYMLCETIPD